MEWIQINSDLWRDLFGVKPQGIFVIVDRMVGQPTGQPGRAELRSIPMWLQLGVQNFTFVSNLCKYKLVDFNYWRLGENLIGRDIFPICQIISQETEFHSRFDVTKSLMNHQLSTEDATLILVVDSTNFMLKINQNGKSMIEDWGLSGNTFDYERLFPRLLEKIGIDSSLPFTETRNFVFHEMTQLHMNELGARPKRLRELFDYNTIPSESYAWKILLDFADRQTQIEFSQHIHESMRAWVEKDITAVANRMLDTLQRFGFNRSKIQDFRRKRLATEVRHNE